LLPRRHGARFAAFSRAAPCRAAASAAAPPAAAAASQEAQQADSLRFKAAIDFKFVKDNVEMLRRNCEVRKAAADPALVAQLYDQFTALKQETDAVRAQRNENSAAMKVGGRGGGGGGVG
jgi:seryl-tRNA synthetase